MTKAERRQQRKRDGLCRDCPDRREVDSVWCRYHLDRDRWRAKTNRRERVARGKAVSL